MIYSVLNENNICRSFNDTNDFQFINEGPIDIDTVLTLDPKTGSVLNSWGRGFFYLPHGITIDYEGNTWLVDVAMHQVFKVRFHLCLFFV